MKKLVCALLNNSALTSQNRDSKRSNGCIFFVVLFLMSSWNQIVFGQKKATVTEKKQAIKTYPYSDPNPIPSMAINNKVARYYPYFIFDGYSTSSTSKKWKVVTLENPYIQVDVLPELGGKVWGATEKSTGKEFVYQNNVLKFRSIGIRGPWTSGGIEHNFGLDLGHAPWTASPVNYITRKNNDGSTSIVVGGLDLASRTQWRVEIRLPKDKAYFKTSSLWYNPKPLHDAYLAWENAAFKATDSLQFFYPGNQSIFHDGHATPWPIDKEGRNLSWYKENNFGSSKAYHVMGTYNDWFGGYWHDDDFGFGNWALYDEAPGKKIFLWSLSRQGAIWEDLLTDNHGQYIEAQSGVKLNQASPESGFNSPFNQLSLRPDRSDTKTDLWFPVKKTNGISDASPDGTLNVLPSEKGVNINLSANSTINDSLFVKRSSNIIYSQNISLEPTQTFQKTIPIEENKLNGTTVTLGHDKLSSTIGESIYEKNDINRPVKSTVIEDYDSPARLFRMAEDENAMRAYDKALEHYLDVLKKEPSHNTTLSRVAEIYYRKAQYELGSKYARKALETDTYNPDANYIYGALQKKMGNFIQAEEAFSIASRSLKYRSGSYAKIAAINLKKKKFKKAENYAQKALDYNTNNLNAYKYLGTSLRKQGKTDESEKIFEKLLKVDPLSNYARFEQYLLNPSEENLSQFNSYIRNEFPEQTYLEIGIKYAIEEGFQKDAIKVLEQAPSHPVINYWLGYLYRDSSNSKSMEYVKQAIQSSPKFVFPFRLESIPVFQWAQEQTNSWKTDYYLGLIYWSKLRNKKAIDLFEGLENKPNYAPFYLARGVLFNQNEIDEQDVLKNFKRAKELNPDEWRTWHFLSEYYLSEENFGEEKKVSKKAYSNFSDNPIISIDLAKAFYNNRDYIKTLKILGETRVLPQEGAREGHNIYENANLSLALKEMKNKNYKEALKYIEKSKKWPEHLGAGKPFDPDIRLQNYIAAYCAAQMGNKEQSQQYLADIKNYTIKHGIHAAHNNPTNNASGVYIGAQILKDKGQRNKATQLVDKWEAEQDSLKNWDISTGSDSPKVQWVIAKFNNEEKAKGIRQKLSANKKRNYFDIFLDALDHVNFN